MKRFLLFLLVVSAIANAQTKAELQTKESWEARVGLSYWIIKNSLAVSPSTRYSARVHILTHEIEQSYNRIVQRLNVRKKPDWSDIEEASYQIYRAEIFTENTKTPADLEYASTGFSLYVRHMQLNVRAIRDSYFDGNFQKLGAALKKNDAHYSKHTRGLMIPFARVLSTAEIPPPKDEKRMSATRKGLIEIRYEIRGTVDSVSITYENGEGSTQQETEEVLPWDKTIYVKPGQFLYISAQNSGDSGYVETRIIKITPDYEQTLRKANSHGAYAIATSNIACPK